MTRLLSCRGGGQLKEGANAVDSTLDRSLNTHKDAFKLQALSWNSTRQQSDVLIPP